MPRNTAMHRTTDMPHLTSPPLKMIFTTYKSDAHPSGGYPSS
jgi:hypothetical protein